MWPLLCNTEQVKALACGKLQAPVSRLEKLGLHFQSVQHDFWKAGIRRGDATVWPLVEI